MSTPTECPGCKNPGEGHQTKRLSAEEGGRRRVTFFCTNPGCPVDTFHCDTDGGPNDDLTYWRV